MCGLAGYYSKENAFTKGDLEKMSACLAHRGPDADGFFEHNGLGFMHRRLSIIDLSTAANQPMFSADGNHVIIFNGEIYNYLEIRAKLENEKGVKFKTNGDTEVILEAFVHYGETFVNMLNGMYAMAIYNQVNSELYIYRDRMGIKPLYYYWQDGNLVFASELKAIKTVSSKINLSINKAAVNEFLHLGYIPEPHSIYAEVKKLPSGCYLKTDGKSIEIKKYWSVNEQVKSIVLTDETQAKEQLKELLFSSVKYRMISDVPYGTFLSGGIDSTTVTAISQQLSEKPVKTFTIRFQDAKFNEADHAKKIAEYLGTDHHEYTVTEKDAIELVEEITGLYDEPYADSSAIPTMLVSKMARQNVTMTLSGDGGDELFFGYGAYQWAKRLDSGLVKALRKPAAFGFSQMNDRFKRIARVFDYETESTKKSHIFSQEQYFFTRQQIRDFLKPEWRDEIKLHETFSQLPRHLTAMEQQALFDLNYYLKDDLLVKVDRASMKYSLETRVPVLDYRIVEFALNLSPDLKIKDGQTKYLLKQVLYDLVPKEYFDRPKWGFSIPLAKWLKTDLKYLVDEYLSEEMTHKCGVLNYGQLEKLKKSFFAGEDNLYNRIWLVILLHKWISSS